MANQIQTETIQIGLNSYKHIYCPDYFIEIKINGEWKPYVDALTRSSENFEIRTTNNPIQPTKDRDLPAYVIHLINQKMFTTILMLAMSKDNLLFLSEIVITDLLSITNLDSVTFFFRDADDMVRKMIADVTVLVDNALEEKYYNIHAQELAQTAQDLTTDYTNKISTNTQEAKTYTETYTDNKFVPQTQVATTNQLGISKPDGNTLKIQDGVLSVAVSGKCVGEIVTSPIPIVDPGLKLLNGDTMRKGGMYDDFIDYIVGLRTKYPSLFTTAANYQTSMNNYGVCGKFVYTSSYYGWRAISSAPTQSALVFTVKEVPEVGDTLYFYDSTNKTFVTTSSTDTPITLTAVEQSANGTQITVKIQNTNTTQNLIRRNDLAQPYSDDVAESIRLPYVTGILEGTLIVDYLGNVTEAGLPNHRHLLDVVHTCCGGDPNWYQYPSWCNGDWAHTSIPAGNRPYTTYASTDNSIYGKSNTVQPQTIKIFYYIVVANNVSASSSINIDQIITELNGKADAAQIATLQQVVNACNANVELVNNKLATKIDNNSLAEVIVVVRQSSATDMPNWYRIWSNGWCEQGGIATITAGYGTVPLAVEFRDIKYTVLANFSGGADVGSSFKNADIVATDSKTTTSFRMLGSTNSDGAVSSQACWYAAGYTDE